MSKKHNIMANLQFSDIQFQDHETQIQLRFLKVFQTSISKDDLKKLGNYKISPHEIEAPDLSDKQLSNKFFPLLDRALQHLTSTLTKHRAIYIHQNSGIPLIGTLYFGIVDRGTNIIEVKPITGCNIDCIFCSVDEGTSSKKQVDFVVEDDYLISEVNKLITFKKQNPTEDNPDTKIDVFINTHGEPLLYSNMTNLIKGLRTNKNINTISIITNATLLTQDLADELIEAGLNQLNISLNAIDPEKAEQLAGTKAYNVNKVIDICCYVADKLKLIIAPVWLKGKNDEQIPKLIDFAKGIGAEIGIQNYMVHKKGKKAAKQVEWNWFYAQLEQWEKETNTNLKTKEHTISKTIKLEKPFRKGDTIRAEIICPGRLSNEVLAVAQDRVLSVVNSKKSCGQTKVRILRDKDNIFIAEEI